MKSDAHTVYVIAIAIILPIVSALIQTFVVVHGFDVGIFLLSTAIWTVFWAIGVRCVASGILRLAVPSTRELGALYLAIGIGGVSTLWFPYWSPVLALVGGTLLAIKSSLYFSQKPRPAKRSLPVSLDLYVAAVTLIYVLTFLGGELQAGF